MTRESWWGADHPRLEEVIESYENSASGNDRLYEEFTLRTARDPMLADHRRYVEENELGFGDPAFHFMWRLLLEHLAPRQPINLLEIGVYKGQVISLWAILLERLGVAGTVVALSPFSGDEPPTSRWKRLWLRVVSPRFRERQRNGDFYQKADYLECCRALFERFGQQWAAVVVIRGFSSDENVRRTAEQREFDVVYVDGDHTYEGARGDFEFYGRLVKRGGFLVADDAGCELAGEKFWKGRPAVSKAAKCLPGIGFVNVVNVGHNRVFRRL